MIAANYTEFRKSLKDFRDVMKEENKIHIIKRNSGKGTILISMAEYNSLVETAYLQGSKIIAERLRESLEQINSGIVVRK